MKFGFEYFPWKFRKNLIFRDNILFWTFSQFKNWFLAIFEIAKKWNLVKYFVKLIYLIPRVFLFFLAWTFFLIFWPTMFYANWGGFRFDTASKCISVIFCKLMDPTDDRHIRKIFARFGMLKTNKRCDYALIIYAPTTKETLKSSFENYSYFVANI